MSTTVTNTLTGATFADGQTATGSWVATYDALGNLTAISDVNITVSDQYVSETFIGAQISASTPGGPYTIQLLSDTSNFNYGSLHENEYGGVFAFTPVSSLSWTGQNPTALDSSSILYDFSSTSGTQNNPDPLATPGVITTSTNTYVPGYTETRDPSDTGPADFESGNTLYVFDSTPKTVELTTDTSIIYEADTKTDGAPNIILPSLAIGDSVTIVSSLVFAGTPPLGGGAGHDAGTNDAVLVVYDSDSSVGIVVSDIGAGHIVQSTDAQGDFIFTNTAPCYRRGTAIRTPAGDVPVESLREGALVTLADGSSAPVIWLGHRTLDCTRHPNPKAIWPVLVRAGAFAEGVPARDLYLSPGHSVFVEGVLMQAEKLINGATILQIETDTVEYWHVELENHSILLAENMPAESYLDQGNRTAFINGGAFVEANPDFQPKHWAETCAKLVFDGPEMQAAKASLFARAAALGYEITHDDDLHVMADGKRIDPVALGTSRVAFLLPAGAQVITLQSRTFVPAHTSPNSGDKRTLGVRVRQLQIDGADVALDDDAAFATGWHKHERRDGTPGTRWTSGPAPIPANTRLIVVDRAGQGLFWVEREQHQDNVIALFA